MVLARRQPRLALIYLLLLSPCGRACVRYAAATLSFILRANITTRLGVGITSTVGSFAR